MRIKILCLLVVVLTLSSCSSWRTSNANPRNWFGGGAPAPTAQASGVPINPSDRQTGNPLISNEGSAVLVSANKSQAGNGRGGLFRRNREVLYEGTIVDQITDVVVDPLPTGVILKVGGEPIREGAFDVRLIQVNPDGAIDGVLEFTLNALQPADFGRGTENTRRVQAAVFLSNADLVDVREIQIRAVRNSTTVRP